MPEQKIYEIGNISNHHGGLYVFEKDGKFYWGIEDVYGDYCNLDKCEEIEKELFYLLIKKHLTS